jgi:subtilisin family serine protease
MKDVVNRGENIFVMKVQNADTLLKLASTKALSNQALRDLELDRIRDLPDVESVEPNYIYHVMMGSHRPKPSPAPAPKPAPAPAPLPPLDDGTAIVPSDPMFASLWGMLNVGQADSSGRTGVADADAKVSLAWNLSKGSRDVIVATVDTGIDYTHPDLKDNVWTKAGTTNVHGYNAITGKEDPMDDNSHGTHVAGTIGAVGDNGIGVAGVNWHVSIMAVKFLSASGSGTLADAIKAIDYARENGAQVMSNSWGGGPYSQELYDAIKRASDAGITFVAAAGNDGSNNDSTPSYPASYQLPNVVSVAASNNVDQLAYFSNYGKTTVDIAAPGENILSTVPNNGYESYSGTSMATPHVSGAIALLLSKEPNLTPAEIKQRLRDTADQLASYKGKIASGGRLNVYRLLNAAR